VFLLGERGKFPPFGVNGGKAAALNRFFYETDKGERSPDLVSKITDVRIARGLRVRLETPGGGGFGDPLTRDPAKVARDVAFGYVSRAKAESDYGVALDANGAVDPAATARLRQMQAKVQA
jgi:N-methylhydantoinase B